MKSKRAAAATGAATGAGTAPNMSPSGQTDQQVSEVALSQRNINALSLVCERFVKEKYQTALSNETLRIILPKIISQILTHYTNNPPMPSVEEINKIAMMQIKNFVLEQQKTESQQVYEPQPHLVPSPIPQQPIPQVQPLPQQQLLPSSSPLLSHDILPHDVLPNASASANPNDIAGFDSYSIPVSGSAKNDDEEVSFEQKLKQLEIERNAGILNTGAPVKDPISINSTEPLNKVQHAVLPQPTIIYVPSQPATNNNNNISNNLDSKVLVINGIDRQWDYFPFRSTISWAGNVPNTATLQVTRMLLPNFVASLTPIIYMEFVGAGNQRNELVFTRSSPTRGLDGNDSSWDIWYPIVSTMPTLASPWTITLYDWSHKPLDMGRDASVVKEATLTVNNFTKLILHPPMAYIKEGHSLSFTNPQANSSQINKHLVVKHIIDQFVVVEGDYSSYKDFIVCDNHCQVHVIIEYSKK